MAGRATNFRDDAGDWQITQAHRLAGKDLMRHQDHRLFAIVRLDGSVGHGLLLPGEV